MLWSSETRSSSSLGLILRRVAVSLRDGDAGGSFRLRYLILLLTNSLAHSLGRLDKPSINPETDRV